MREVARTKDSDIDIEKVCCTSRRQCIRTVRIAHAKRNLFLAKSARTLTHIIL